MAGVKGRSGRRTVGAEEQRLRVLQRAWVILEESLSDPDVLSKEKREIALKLCVKDIPTELSGGFTAQVTQMPMIQKGSGEASVNLNFNIGTHADPSEDS